MFFAFLFSRIAGPCTRTHAQYSLCDKGRCLFVFRGINFTVYSYSYINIVNTLENTVSTYDIVHVILCHWVDRLFVMYFKVSNKLSSSSTQENFLNSLRELLNTWEGCKQEKQGGWSVFGE